MENTQKFLQIMKSSEAILDKNDKNYKRISVKPLASVMVDPATGEEHPVVDMTAREVSFNQYEENYLDGSKDPAYDAPVGTLLPGSIVSKSVEDYSFINNEGDTVEASTYTTAVFGDTSDEKLFQSNIFAAFRRADHRLENDPTEIVISEEEEATAPVED